ncbi:MAG: glycoside hydrolase family 20 zincin-like fold domain-containing protein [bacterium]
MSLNPLYFLALFSLTTLLTLSSTAAPVALSPKPEKVKWEDGVFVLSSFTHLKYSGGDLAKSETEALSEAIRPATGFTLRIGQVSAGAMLMNAILLELNPVLEPTLGEKGYRLTVTKGGVWIVAASPDGLALGCKILLQLMPSVISSKTVQTDVKWEIPCCLITDHRSSGQAPAPLNKP